MKIIAQPENQDLERHPLVRRFESQCDDAKRLGGEAVSSVLDRADQALRGLLVLPGNGGRPVPVGSPPDWRLDPYDYTETAGTLNRMSHWIVLLRAWRLTGRGDYAQRVIDELADWIADCPCPLPPGSGPEAYAYRDQTPWRLLEVGIRPFEAWVPCLLVLRRAGLIDDGLYADTLSVCDDHARVLAVCAPIDSRPVSHNHLLMEMLGLLYLALALPETERSADDLALARDELCRAVGDQVTPEGAQAEGCPMYHNLSLGLFAHAAAVMRAFGVEPPATLTDAVARMAEYSIQATRPSGKTVPWGDSDVTGSTWTAARWCFAATGDATLLRQMRDLCGPDEARRVIDDGLWDVALEDREALSEALATGHADPAPRLWVGREIKQASLRTGWDRDDWHVFFGCQLPTFNTHAHADPAGFELSAAGVTPLPDPGRFTYAENDHRRQLKSARWHNTVTVNGLEPFEYLNTWAWGPQGEGRLGAALDDPRLLAVSCEHDSYDPVSHRRLMLLGRPGGLVVVDQLAGLRDGDRVDAWFHCDTQEQDWRPTATGWVFNTLGRGFEVVLRPDGVQTQPIPSSLSEKLDHLRPSQRVHAAYPVAAGQGTLLLTTIVQATQGPSLAEGVSVLQGSEADRDAVRIVLPRSWGGGTLSWRGDTLTPSTTGESAAVEPGGADH
ncbi:MAG: alginate lyase family protein [Planctomycetota bacterium]